MPTARLLGWLGHDGVAAGERRWPPWRRTSPTGMLNGMIAATTPYGSRLV